MRATTPAPEKQRIEADASSPNGTDHLLPVIAFLKVQGNTPAADDAFQYNRDGLGVYGFAQPVDVALLQAHFDFPPSIHLSVDGLHDSRHFVRIQHTPTRPVRRFSFEQ